MSKAVETTTKTIALLKDTRPHVEELLTAFEPLLLARVEITSSLAEQVSALPLPSVDPQRFSDGLSLLADTDLTMFLPAFAGAAAALLPVFAGREHMVPGFSEVKDLLAADRPEKDQEAFLHALLHQEEEDAAAIAGVEGLPAAGLCFMGEFALSCVFRAATAAYVSKALAGQTPWPLWVQGSCPVCGRMPILHTLARPVNDEKNPYLVSGGGRKHMHCGLCGADWVFRRAACPACGADRKGVMNVLTPTANQAEQIAWCDECRTYTVGLDERSFSSDLDMDAVALSLIHLDMVAAEKHLSPVCRTLWNQY